jgi:hypothetical protein
MFAITVLLVILGSIALGVGIYLVVRLGRFPVDYTTVEHPVPPVAFPFEPLNDLGAELSRRFEPNPIRKMPLIKLAAAGYFKSDTNVFYHPADNTVYFKDTYANQASPESLGAAMMRGLIQCWLWQYRAELLGGMKIDARTFDACNEVAAALMGIRNMKAYTT